MEITSPNLSPELFTEETVLFNNLKPSVRFNASMLLVDIVSSTDLLLRSGDTGFINRMYHLHSALCAHPLAADMLYLECTGDGYKLVYKNVSVAVEVAQNLRLLQDEAFQLRFVIHWGSVKVGPNNNPIGVEVHRLFRVEAIQEADRVSSSALAEELPKHSRIIITRAGLDRLSSRLRSKFELIGSYRLKGFDQPEEVWAEKKPQGIIEIIDILHGWNNSDDQARDKLVTSVIAKFREMAKGFLKSRNHAGLNPALHSIEHVKEAYLKLKKRVDAEPEAGDYLAALCIELLCDILVDYALSKVRSHADAVLYNVPLGNIIGFTWLRGKKSLSAIELIAFHRALIRFELKYKRESQVYRLTCFSG